MTALATSSIDTTVSRQWATRPSDERFTNLHALGAKLRHDRDTSRSAVVSSRSLDFVPEGIDGLKVAGKAGVAYDPSHWSFGQLCQRAGAPAGYLRSLPAPMAADCLNYGFKHSRDVEDVGLLLRSNGTRSLAAATGPNYGRVWNSEIADTLIDRFGNGVDGDWRVPGEFGVRTPVTKDNTTLYASDRDMFVFLADETNRVTIPNRRDGKSGSLARGFYVSNSEVGAGTLTVAMYLFDYACQNRILWGVADFRKISIRHSKGAPDRYLEEVLPAINAMGEASAQPIEATLKAAQAAKVDRLAEFLASRFTSSQVTGIKAAFEADESRPLITKDGDAPSVWDVVTATTAYARGISFQDERVKIEREAGRMLELVEVR